MRNAEKSIGFTTGVRRRILSIATVSGEQMQMGMIAHRRTAVTLSRPQVYGSRLGSQRKIIGGLHVYQQVPGNKAGFQM